MIKTRIERLRKVPIDEGVILDCSRVSLAIKRLQEDFIVVPVDKAPNNYSFICKLFYMQVMCKELGLVLTPNGVQLIGNDVYSPCTVEESDVVKRHERVCVQMTKNSIADEDKKLPVLHALPKMHKTPYKYRFIAGARNCSTRSVALVLQKSLKLLRDHVRNYCDVVCSRKGFCVFWSVESSLQVLQKLQGLNITGKTLFTADFASLFTSLPLKMIESNINSLVTLCFKNAGRKGILIGPDKAFYADKCDSNGRCVYLEQDDVKYLINWVLYNSYIKFGDYCLQQKNGVPMGGNASPLLADLALIAMEYRYLTDVNNQRLARRFQHVFRYVDDVLVISSGSFEDISKDIYGDVLVLEKTNTGGDEANFLDLNLRIVNDKLVTKIYNKTDDFPFKVVRYPHTCSNIHFKVVESSFTAEALRFIRATTELAALTVRLRELVVNFRNNGLQPRILKRLLISLLSTRKGLMFKFALHDSQAKLTFIESLF